MRSRARCFIILVGFCAFAGAPVAMADCPPPPDPSATVPKVTPSIGNLTVGDDMVLKPVARPVEPRAKPIKVMSPIYPVCAKEARITGFADVAFTVEQDGAIDNIKILQEGPAGFGFGEAAVKAVSQWKYEPAVVDGKPVASVTRLRLAFHPPFRSFKGEDHPPFVPALPAG